MNKLLVYLLLLISLATEAKENSVCCRKKEVFDINGVNVETIFTSPRTKYILKFEHVFSDTLIIPKNCEIEFKGGSLRGPVVFRNTRLSGEVDIKGSSIKGKIRNKIFDASWLCYADGKTDDAPQINEIIQICDKIFFPKGVYYLKTAFTTAKQLPGKINAHIGIDRDNVSLKGEDGAVFKTQEPLGTICIFSDGTDITNSVKNINIENLIFHVINDGVTFYEFMHTIRCIGVNGLSIKGCFFYDFWGDAICLSTYNDTPKTGERTRNQNVSITENKIIGGTHHNNRNGISVVNGKDVLIKGNTIKSTSRKDMPGAIDVEPNNQAYTIENIRIINNEISDCGGTAGGICIHANEKGGPAHDILIDGNIINNCTAGLSFVVKSELTTDNYRIINNFVDKDTKPYQFVGEGKSINWTIKNNTFEQVCRQNIPGKIKVKNLVVRNNKKKD